MCKLSLEACPYHYGNKYATIRGGFSFESIIIVEKEEVRTRMNKNTSEGGEDTRPHKVWFVRHRSLSALITLVILAVFMSIYLANRPTIQHWINASGPLGTIAILLIFLLGALIPGPIHDLLAILAGSLFGFFIGFIIAWLMQFISSIIGYYLVRNSVQEFSAANEYKQKLEKSKWFKWLANLPVNSPLFLIVGRWFPYVGGHIVYIMAGIYKVPIQRFIWCTAISVILPAMEFSAIGAGLTNIFGK